MNHDNKHIGPSLDDFLENEGILEEATATAKKRIAAMSKSYLTLPEMLEHSNERASKLYKWALVNGEFRFVHITYGETHLYLVDEGDVATDAGTIMVADDYWRVSTAGRGSGKLKVGCSDEAETALETALADAGRELKRN